MRHDLAVIVPTRNRPDIARKNLEKIRAHFPDVPICVFDDASDDAVAVRRAVESVPDCKLIRSDVNIGPAGARRALIEAAEARWCLAIDDDCYPREDFDPAPWIDAEPGPGDPIVIGLTLYRSYDGDISPQGRSSPGSFPAFHGGASLLHRARLMEIGNYNPAYVFGAEDTDVARRVWASGYQVWHDPTKFIIHDHVAAGRNLPRESYFYVRNRILLAVMTLPVWYGLPLGLGQAFKRWLIQPYKWSGFLGLFAGLGASIRHFPARRPLSLRQYRELQGLHR
jgi:GT2 family glycosyltransferase